jgi:subtilisin family serine protease
MSVTRPTVAGDESDLSYTDKLSGRELAFTPARDEAVVTFHRPPSETDIDEAMASTPLAISEGYNPKRGFAAVRVADEDDIAAATQPLLQRPEVANALPVMVDADGLKRHFLPDELTVQFKTEVGKDEAERIIGEHGSLVIAEQRTPGYYTIAVPKGRGLFETIRRFAAVPEVAFAEPSEVSFNSALYIPDDPRFAELWGLHNTGQNVNGTAGAADADIDAREAWDLERGHPNVVVAVIDTGADLDHPDLQPNILPRGTEDWDFGDAGDPVPDDGDGHGTHVAGTVGAVDNATGVIGVAPGCRLMPLRVDLTTGMNQNRADAINYVAQQAVANANRRYVINCSWRMNGDHAGVRNAIINAVNSNVVVVFAAGNANQDTDVTPQFPGVYPQVIAVAATDQSDVKATFSNFGTNVDVSAPGVNILSTFPNDGYDFLDGTSMAAPHVAGLAALVWSRSRALTNQRVRQTIEATCDNIDAANPNFVGRLGRGRINAHRALARTQVCAINSQGRLWHTIRFAGGSWQPFGDVEGQTGEMGKLEQAAAATQLAALHVCAVNSQGRLWHTIRFPDGSWQPFGDVEGQTGDMGKLRQVAAAGHGGQLHVCAINSHGRLWHTIRFANGSWQPFGDVEGQTGEMGKLRQVAVAAVGADLHVCAINSRGRLWHTIRFANGNWQPFGDVEGQTGEMGKLRQVAAAGHGGQLHVCAVNSQGRLWHTIRFANGSWQPFGDIEGQTGDMGTLREVAAGVTAGQLHVCAVNSQGRLWHTIRFANGSWQPFGDVEGQTGEMGTLRVAAVAGE